MSNPPDRAGVQRRSRLRWALAVVVALLPLAAGAALAAVAATGGLPDARVRVALSAQPHDWFLAAGAVPTVLALGVLALLARRDAVAHRRAAELVSAAAEERRLLLSRLDHELKNPLTAMRAAVANLSSTRVAVGPEGRGPGDDDGTAAALASIEEQAVRLSRLTGDLRKIADVRSGVLERSPVDLAPLLADAVSVVQSPRGPSVHLDLPRAPWPLPPVLGDHDVLELAVVNLLDNAVKYTPPDGTVEVRARHSGRDVVLEVADTGPGIAAEELEQVWEELYRSPRTRAVPGSGLGLALVRAVAERHGGSASVESRVGRGTAVRLVLPAADGAQGPG
ncbi:sensor histidine kinase [Quadrisphaera setariae]|uniref:sensor histidine kinase n=1 Tax=Quadrisphaera setariae TaxID=2593304 RepID=UPI001C9C1445|nr:HAMP domain-containing sensor histidine kinase [Quadrisphaera setariae]